MKWPLNFRQRILTGYILLSCIFIFTIYFFVSLFYQQVFYRTLSTHIAMMIAKLQQTGSESEMIERLDYLHEFAFFRVSLFNGNGEMLYDNAMKSLKTKNLSPYALPQWELSKTLRDGHFHIVEDSPIFQQKLAYVLTVFPFQGSTYILRGSLPFGLLNALTTKMKSQYLIFVFLNLLVFIGCIWLVFHRVNYPIRQIIKAILPFQKGQEEFIAQITLPPSVDKNDQFYKLAETLNALSDRIRVQIRHIMEERNEKEAILESLGEGVLAVDKDMRIRYVNYIGSRMIGLPRKQLTGKSFAELEGQKASPLLEKSRHLLETCQNKMTILTDSIFITEGKKIYLDLVAAPKLQQNGAILVLQDKSSHYKVLEMGKDFVANASHELRTPITIVRGFAETLHDMPELPREMVSEITEKIVRNCQRMDNLVKNLLTLADLENIPESRFQECDLGPLLENSKQVVLSIYEDGQIRIEKSKESIIVDADPDILELAIINLMDNAAKYSPSPARIAIKIDQIGDEAQIIIADKGIGIPSEDIEHIFERFYTVNKAHSRRLGGAGLGLSIVKTIIEKHHGSIAVSSAVRQGTTFTITLPIHRISIF